MDVFLCASCKFFLGSDSGLGDVAAMFGRPVAIANAAPFFHAIRSQPQAIGIPKLYWCRDEKRYLAFGEVAESPASSYRLSHLFDEAHLTLVDNSPDEIRDLALEMLERLDGVATYTGEDEILQNQLRSLMKPTHYTYGAPGRVGRDFLRKYQALLK
jgi:putative glycosyltransferase (TIGR04372 family)